MWSHRNPSTGRLRSLAMSDMRLDLAKCEDEYANLGVRDVKVEAAIAEAREAVTAYYERRGHGDDARRLVATVRSRLGAASSPIGTKEDGT